MGELRHEAAHALSHTVTAPAAAREVGAPAALVAGQQLGHFRIERQLGAGGMGEVYLATDLALDRAVAIKVLPEDTARDAGRRERLIREARAQARITHPNVGHIYFIGEDAGRLYFAMEYVAGETLAERTAAGPLAPDAALDVIHAAALGLREAQRSGFTHRDVKPSNLMVDGNGVLKVLDFGLVADAGVRDDGPASPTTPQAQTSAGGTPLYMAPEQARGAAIDFRADIYALGATLFHLVTGAPPFVADTLDALRTLHATAPRPAVKRRGLPRTAIATIDALCTRMMAPDPADRFASYDELLRAIELASARHTRPAGFSARAMAVTIDLAIVAIVIAGGDQLLALVTGYELSDNGPMILLAQALYTWLATARWGRTLGGALFELEVIDVTTGRPPRWPVAALRTMYLFGIAVAAGFAEQAVGGRGVNIGTLVPVSIVAAGLALVYASARTPGKRAWWDRATHTMVRYHTRAP